MSLGDTLFAKTFAKQFNAVRAESGSDFSFNWEDAPVWNPEEGIQSWFTVRLCVWAFFVLFLRKNAINQVPKTDLCVELGIAVLWCRVLRPRLEFSQACAEYSRLQGSMAWCGAPQLHRRHVSVAGHKTVHAALQSATSESYHHASSSPLSCSSWCARLDLWLLQGKEGGRCQNFGRAFPEVCVLGHYNRSLASLVQWYSTRQLARVHTVGDGGVQSFQRVFSRARARKRHYQDRQDVWNSMKQDPTSDCQV